MRQRKIKSLSPTFPDQNARLQQGKKDAVGKAEGDSKETCNWWVPFITSQKLFSNWQLLTGQQNVSLQICKLNYCFLEQGLPSTKQHITYYSLSFLLHKAVLCGCGRWGFDSPVVSPWLHYWLLTNSKRLIPSFWSSHSSFLVLSIANLPKTTGFASFRSPQWASLEAAHKSRMKDIINRNNRRGYRKRP